MTQKMERFKREIAEAFDKPRIRPTLSGKLDFTDDGKPDGAEIDIELGNPKVTQDDSILPKDAVD